MMCQRSRVFVMNEYLYHRTVSAHNKYTQPVTSTHICLQKVAFEINGMSILPHSTAVKCITVSSTLSKIEVSYFLRNTFNNLCMLFSLYHYNMLRYQPAFFINYT